MSTGAWIVVAAVVVALGFGLWRAMTDGRFRATARSGVETGGRSDTPSDTPGDAPAADGGPATGSATASSAGVLEGTPWAEELGERATLLQFSSAFCAPCRATRRILEDVAGAESGVSHVEVDAEAHLDVVRRLGILRTPTTLVLDAAGRELVRAAGAPTRTQVVAALPSRG